MSIFTNTSTGLCALVSLAFMLVSQTSAQIAPGTYYIQNAASHNVLNIAGANSAIGTPIIEWPLAEPITSFENQLWTFNANANTLQAVSPSTGFVCEHGVISEPCVTSGQNTAVTVQLTRFNGNIVIEAPDGSGAVLTAAEGVANGPITMSPGSFEGWTLDQQWEFVSV